MGRRVNYIFLSILLLALLLRLKGIETPLLDNQAWRQTDTAGMAVHMLGHLGDIPGVFIPMLNYDGSTPQRVELEFPFLPYLLALTWSLLGRADIWGRLLATGFSLLTVWGIYELSRNVFSERAALIASGIYAVMPLAVYYGRVVMPEPVAQAFSIWALNAMWYWRSNPNRKRRLIAAGIMMAAAILAKLPQLMLFPVALVMFFFPFRGKSLRQVLVYSAISIIPPMVYYLWVHWGADPSSQFVSGIISGQVVGNNNFYRDQLYRNIRQGISYGVLVLAVIGTVRLFAVKSPARFWVVLWLVFSAVYVLTVCMRIPLDYYLMPVLPLAAILGGTALEILDDTPGTVSIVLLLIILFYNGYKELAPKYSWNPRYLTQAEWLVQNTPKDSILLLSDSPPMTFYYSHRVGYRLTGDDNASLQVLDNVSADYLVHLPESGRSDSFWREVNQCFSEVGPGIFKLKKQGKDCEFVD